MNQHRETNRQQLRAQLEVIAGCQDQFVVHAGIIEYQKRYGDDSWLRKYQKKAERAERGYEECAARSLQ